MEYAIETRMNEFGWTQMMECHFVNEAIAKLVLEDTPKKHYHDRDKPYIMNAHGLCAARLIQDGSVISVFCESQSSSLYWVKDHETNVGYLSELGQTWKEQAAQWDKIRRYVNIAVVPGYRELERRVGNNRGWIDSETSARDRCAFKDDVWPALDAIGERSWRNENHVAELNKLVQKHADDRIGELVDIYDCMEIDNNQAAKDRQEMKEDFLRSLHVMDTLIAHMGQMLSGLESHIGKRFAHFRKEG